MSCISCVLCRNNIVKNTYENLVYVLCGGIRFFLARGGCTQARFSNGRLETDLYVKPTDKHQYLLKSSCHPSHTKQSIPFSMALRLRRICSTDEFFNTRSDALTTHLIKRRYPHRFIKEEIEKVRHISRSKALETSMKDQSNKIPFVVTFNLALPNMRRIIFNNLNILRSSQRCKVAFPSPPPHIISPMQQPT